MYDNSRKMAPLRLDRLRALGQVSESCAARSVHSIAQLTVFAFTVHKDHPLSFSAAENGNGKSLQQHNVIVIPVKDLRLMEQDLIPQWLQGKPEFAAPPPVTEQPSGKTKKKKKKQKQKPSPGAVLKTLAPQYVRFDTIAVSDESLQLWKVGLQFYTALFVAMVVIVAT